jgi:Flp pilus assembly protein TadB
MPEHLLVTGSLAAGLLCGAAVFAAGGAGEGFYPKALARLHAARHATERALRVAAARDWLELEIERAGWHESPERIAVLGGALAACLAVIGASSASVVAPGTAVVLSAVGFVSGAAVPLLALRSAVDRRRERLSGELPPLLELLSLELSGGGSALSALGSVTVQVQGELATDLRRLLIASQVSGSASFEARLIEYAQRLEIPAIGSLATILAASREYGTGVVHGVRALATDLRRAQRRDLIAHSRRALNHVLLPAAVGVLLPFLAVLMFPAVTALQRNLR